MRSLKSISAVSVLAAALAIAPSSASAFKHPSPRGRCRIDIRVMPHRIEAGEPTEVSGRLLCRRASAGGQSVELYAHAAGSAGFVPVQSTTTEANGSYKLTTAAETANTVFYVRSHGAQSARRRLWVEAQVTFNGPAEGSQIETGPPNQVTFTGTVNPATDVGARVILQRQNAVSGDEWHRIDIGTVMPGGSYSITHTFRVPGDASIRVLVRSDGLNVPSASTPVEYEISQAQNPALTIISSADPIVFGQSVTISGVLAAATSAQPQPVTLLARTVHQRGFAPVAQVNTGENGSYTFPAQSPVNSTLYRVASTAERSAVLYEGVKDVLTAEASPTTLMAGEAVTFKGTVAPAHEGHVIYLERQNARNTGFHVVQISHVLPGSTYSIVHQVYVPGTKVYRIDIPGGPENGRALSQPFTITVTAALASALAPEAPGNASLPSEGQTTGSGGGETGSGSLESEPSEMPPGSGSHGPKSTETPGGSESPSGKQPKRERGHRRFH